jgi:uncharacterized protein DUF2846
LLRQLRRGSGTRIGRHRETRYSSFIEGFLWGKTVFKSLKTGALAALVMVSVPASVAWASDDQTYAVRHASEPAIPAGDGRIYFYREGGLVGAALQPTITINGESSGGRAKPGDYFYVDRPAGTYEIMTETEKKEAVSLTLAAGQSLYVRFDVSMGFFVGHVSPSIIDPQQALTEIKDCDWHEPHPVEPAEGQAPQPAPAAAPAQPAAPAATAPAQPDATSSTPPK